MNPDSRTYQPTIEQFLSFGHPSYKPYTLTTYQINTEAPNGATNDEEKNNTTTSHNGDGPRQLPLYTSARTGRIFNRFQFRVYNCRAGDSETIHQQFPWFKGLHLITGIRTPRGNEPSCLYGYVEFENAKSIDTIFAILEQLIGRGRICITPARCSKADFLRHCQRGGAPRVLALRPPYPNSSVEI